MNDEIGNPNASQAVQSTPMDSLNGELASKADEPQQDLKDKKKISLPTRAVRSFFPNYQENADLKIKVSELEKQLEAKGAEFDQYKMKCESEKNSLMNTMSDMETQIKSKADEIEKLKKMLDESRISLLEKEGDSKSARIENLEEHCLSTLKTMQDFKAVKDSPIYNDLSSDTKALLFEKMLIACVDQANLPVTGQRAFKTFDGSYLRASQGADDNASWFVDKAPHCRSSEQWHIEQTIGGKVLLKAHCSKYVRAYEDGRVDLATRALGWEMWRPMWNDDCSWSFKSHHGTWLSANRDDGIVCTTPNRQKCERFQLEPW